jgi:hypothetical protein
VQYHHASKQAGSSAAAALNVDTGSAISIGQDPTGTYGETGAGDIDDLGVWHKALTPLEASAIYLAGVSNQLSFVGAPVTLNITKSGSTVTLTWVAGILQSSDNANGPFADVSGSSSPFTVSTSAAKKFYRVKQ